MKLQFGDVAAKKALADESKRKTHDAEVFERRVQACLRELRSYKLPPDEAPLAEYPRVQQRFGLDACREAARRIRAGN